MTDKTPLKFTFLHDHIAREPFIFDVLNEIQRQQDGVIKNGEGPLATIDSLKESRNIKMPFTPSRNKNIAYLLETLTGNYPGEIKKIISFTFSVEPETKKLSIDEKTEFTVLMKHDLFNKIQDDRDRGSSESLQKLLSSFRLFNLTKLLKKTKFRENLSDVVKLELGKNIFTYKFYSLDKNNLEFSEDYCFHLNNYEAVKNAISIEKIQDIIRTNSVQLIRRLKNFGILNTEVSDFRDNKLDYILNILLKDIASSLTEKDLTEIKNFNSLRDCLRKVDRVIDPFLTVSADIMNYIRENGTTRKSEIMSLFPGARDKSLEQWLRENDVRNSLIYHEARNGDAYIIFPSSFLPAVKDLHLQIIGEHEHFAGLNYHDQNEKLSRMDLLCEIGTMLLTKRDRGRAVIKSDENIGRLEKIISEYQDYRQRDKIAPVTEIETFEQTEMSILGIIVSFFRSLFGGGRKNRATEKKGLSRGQRSGGTAAGKAPSKDLKEIINKIKNSQSKVIPLPDYIELSQDNEKLIDAIIEDLRNGKTKIVIPIYNARRVLYPVRSQKLIIPDMDSLMVDQDISMSSDLIREFTDSLPGEKIKDEMISNSAINAIEKYLLTLYRQRRARHMKKG